MCLPPLAFDRLGHLKPPCVRRETLVKRALEIHQGGFRGWQLPSWSFHCQFFVLAGKASSWYYTLTVHHIVQLKMPIIIIWYYLDTLADVICIAKTEGLWCWCSGQIWVELTAQGKTMARMQWDMGHMAQQGGLERFWRGSRSKARMILFCQGEGQMVSPFLTHMIRCGIVQNFVLRSIWVLKNLHRWSW